MYQTAYMYAFRSIPFSDVTHHRWGRKHESDRLVISPQQRPVRLVELHAVRARRTLAHARRVLRLSHDDFEADELVGGIRHDHRGRRGGWRAAAAEVRRRGRGRVRGRVRAGVGRVLRLGGGDKEVDDGVRNLFDVSDVHLELSTPVARLRERCRNLVWGAVPRLFRRSTALKR